ncbi:MAG: L-2-hydroxyglutarate oxidase, partial [Planctomycetaceae bacterium]|nr:L-2-hydroxyglutarate oxidase [Planctomycetaceae bacterium]
EPHTAGIKAIHVPEAGICDFRKVCLKLAERLQEREAIVQTNARVTRILKQENSVVVESTAGSFEARYLVNCAGLHSDRVASLTGFRAASKIVPFRGEYYDLKPHVENLCRNLIYPVPNPKFPFLGVHFTRMINGGVECGPNAVLAFAREGYRKRDVNLYDLGESLTYPGFLRLARKNWRAGCGEMWRSFSKRAFVRALQRLVPSIRGQDLVAARAGVRAQALARDGQLVDDFRIRTDECIVNVDNAPSPAATSSLNIGRLVAETLAQQI